MRRLAGGARISFEGDLAGLHLLKIPGASESETASLKRSTQWPVQDFVVVPLEPDTVASVLSAIGGTVSRKSLHVQIEQGGKLEFAAYDRFHEECIVFGDGVDRSFIKGLVSEGALTSFKES